MGHKEQNKAKGNTRKDLIHKHQNYTGSDTARQLLSNWETAVVSFVKVMPIDYKQALADQAAEVAAAKS